jgi:hypothetical protein
MDERVAKMRAWASKQEEAKGSAHQDAQHSARLVDQAVAAQKKRKSPRPLEVLAEIVRELDDGRAPSGAEKASFLGKI